MTVKQPLIRFTVMDLTDEIESEEDCYPEEILPGEVYYCIFDLTELGDKNLKVMASEMLNEGQDYRPSDNTITQTSEVIAGEISPQIEQSNFNGEYNTGDTITFNARTSSLAASPLTYTWLQAGIIDLGDEKELNISGSFLGLGDHYISVRVTDALGTIDSQTIQVTVFNSTIIDSGNWLTGTAVTRTHAKGEAEYQLPMAGFNYGSGQNNDALMIMSIEVSSTDGSSDPGMDWMEFDVNLTEILPDNIPRESISVNQLFGMDQINWAPLEENNYFTLIDNNTMRIHIEDNMDLIFIGDLPEPNITAGQPEITLLPDGAMRVDWEPQGDLQNQYFGGWKIYRMTGIPNGTTYFPDPAVYTNEFEWNLLLEYSLADYVPAETNTWTDTEKLETGTCVSYAVIPANRAGTPSPLSGYVTRVNGEPGLTCGDAIDPLREVTSFTSSLVYNNDTACYNSSGNEKGNFKTWDACYELTLSWEWPNDEPEGNISWNLYRIELKPNDVDLRFVEPIATNIDNVPGEKAYFYQNGTDDCPANCDNGIRPYRTYYYILTPVDHIGNELTIIDYPSSNIKRVNIQSEHWNYNSYRVPEPEPEPEPPMGVDWFGELQEDVETESFQLAGMAMLSILIMNLIGLPLILKRRKKLKRVISKRISKTPTEFDENEFDDFFS
jgi:hypothetical protein